MLLMLVTSGIIDLGRVGVVWVVRVIVLANGSDIRSVLSIVVGRVRSVVIVNGVGRGFGEGLRYRRGVGS